MLLSYGTRLRVVSSTDAAVEVVLLDGRHAFLRRGVAVLHKVNSPWPEPDGRQARR